MIYKWADKTQKPPVSFGYRYNIITTGFELREAPSSWSPPGARVVFFSAVNSYGHPSPNMRIGIPLSELRSVAATITKFCDDNGVP